MQMFLIQATRPVAHCHGTVAGLVFGAFVGLPKIVACLLWGSEKTTTNGH
jgi:hypothetical protein